MEREHLRKKIDDDVVAQADDDPAREKPIHVRRKKRRLWEQNTIWQRRTHSVFTLNLNHVRCSPFRVPVVRLAAAQAALTLIAKDK
jgi:hypothetical protein